MRGRGHGCSECSECESAQDLPMLVLSVCHQAAQFRKGSATGRALIRIAVSTRTPISICKHRPPKFLRLLVLAHEIQDLALSFLLPAAVPWPKTGKELVVFRRLNWKPKKCLSTKTNELGHIGVEILGKCPSDMRQSIANSTVPVSNSSLTPDVPLLRWH